MGVIRHVLSLFHALLNTSISNPYDRSPTADPQTFSWPIRFCNDTLQARCPARNARWGRRKQGLEELIERERPTLLNTRNLYYKSSRHI